MGDFEKRTRELLDTVFGEGRVQLTSRMDEDPPMLEVGDGQLWLSPPNEDCPKFAWGSATYVPGTYDCPPDCDVVDLGEAERQDDAIKAIILLYAEQMLSERFDHEADEAYAREFERAQQ